MPFTSETAIYGGAKPGAGRKKGDPVKKAAAQIAREFIERSVIPIMETYLGLAAGQVVKRVSETGEESFELKVDPATTRHAIDKEQVTAQPTAIIHQFIQFTNNQNTAQLPTEAVSTPILVGDGRGQEEGGEGMASPFGERQNGLEFHSFTNVRGK